MGRYLAGEIMRLSFFILLVIAGPALADKDDLAKAVEARSDDAWRVAREIWSFAEPGYLESKSSTLLANTLQNAGFKVDRGVAKIPTAFTATYGEGKPVIGILG